VRNRLWAWTYGTTLILIGVGLAVWGVVRIVQGAGPEGVFFLVASLATQGFVAFGAVVLGIERIRGRGSDSLRSIVRPDEVLVEKYGPKGEKWK
jgi:hypothetical protein